MGHYARGKERPRAVPSPRASSTKLRRRLRHIVDELPDQELSAAQRYLEYLRVMTDPLFRALVEAAEDDEPETPEEVEALREARKHILHGRVVPHDEARRQLLEA